MLTLDANIQSNTSIMRYNVEVLTDIQSLLKKNYFLPEESRNVFSKEYESNLHYPFYIKDIELESKKNLSDHDFLEVIQKDLKLYEFLKSKGLLVFLPEIENRINLFFPNHKITMFLKQDVEEGYFTVFIKILTHLSVSEALKQKRIMVKDWDLLKNNTFNQYINISPEYL